MNQHYMIDIETTGLNKAMVDDILQIGLLEVNLDERGGFYVPGKTYSRFLPSLRRPRADDKFALEHMVAMYDHCNTLEQVTPQEVREDILRFFASCGTQKARLMGKNLADFDVPFCENRKFLAREDRHYRLYELTGTINTLMDSMMLDQDKDRYAFLDWAHEVGFNLSLDFGIHTPLWDTINALTPDLPKYKDHEAIFDCYRQFHELNGMLAISRWGAAKQADEIHRFREIKAELDARKARG